MQEQQLQVTLFLEMIISNSEPAIFLFFLMGDGLLKVQRMGTGSFTPQKYLLTRICQQLSRQGPERMAMEPNLRY